MIAEILVLAVEKITELDPGGMEIIHAEPGDIGMLQECCPEWANVTWRRTGTTTVCHCTELSLPDDGPQTA